MRAIVVFSLVISTKQTTEHRQILQVATEATTEARRRPTSCCSSLDSKKKNQYSETSVSRKHTLGPYDDKKVWALRPIHYDHFEKT